MRILNNHEFVAAGIRGKAYDENLFKRMQCAVVIRDWEAFCGFVIEFRKLHHEDMGDSAETFYQDFEWLAGRWKKNPLKRSESWWPL